MRLYRPFLTQRMLFLASMTFCSHSAFSSSPFFCPPGDRFEEGTKIAFWISGCAVSFQAKSHETFALIDPEQQIAFHEVNAVLKLFVIAWPQQHCFLFILDSHICKWNCFKIFMSHLKHLLQSQLAVATRPHSHVNFSLRSLFAGLSPWTTSLPLPFFVTQ